MLMSSSRKETTLRTWRAFWTRTRRRCPRIHTRSGNNLKIDENKVNMNSMILDGMILMDLMEEINQIHRHSRRLHRCRHGRRQCNMRCIWRELRTRVFHPHEHQEYQNHRGR